MKKMLDFFGKDTPIEKISTDNAVVLRRELQKTGVQRGKKKLLSESTISRTIKQCRHVFRIAKQWKLIAENPFDTVRTGTQRNPKRLYFVSETEAQALIDVCNSPKQRSLLPLHDGADCVALRNWSI